MTGPSIPDSTTGTVTRTADLYADFCAELRRRHAEAGGKPFFASHREIADELGCSAGNLTRLMERAIEDGILYRKKAGKTYRLTLIGHSRVFVPAPPQAEIDQLPLPLDTETQAPSALENEPPSAAFPSLGPGLIDHDQPHVVHEIQDQQQQQKHDQSARDEALEAALLAALVPLARQNTRYVDQILAERPDLTLAEITEKCAAAESRHGVHTPPGLVLWAIRYRQDIAPSRDGPAPRMLPTLPDQGDTLPRGERRPARRRQEHDRPIDPVAAVASNPGLYRFGSDVSDLEAAPAPPGAGPPVVPRHLLDKARKLVPEAADDELPDLALLAAAGASATILRSELDLVRRRRGEASYAA